MRRQITKCIKRILIGFFIVLFICLVLVFVLDYKDIPFRLKINISQRVNPWTEVLVSLLSSLLAATATILAVLLTLDNQEKQRQEDNKKQVLPLLKIELLERQGKVNSTCSELHINAKPLKYFHNDYEVTKSSSATAFKIKNVGMREMYDVKIETHENDNFENSALVKVTPVLYKGDEFFINVYINDCVPSKRYPKNAHKAKAGTISEHRAYLIIRMYYSDCYANEYIQDFKITLHSTLAPIDNNKKESDYYKTYNNFKMDKVDVISAPTEKTQKQKKN